ncbi:O-methyltransferase [Longirhabdus pacifica]|uniref:O-methyltransferase n=1 Tax=Longirhabdus pacifica TaxID=2305227 RepID=UPI00100921A9|nr:O-methyltransferase [Longirhabdus pacifica]
MATEQWKQVDDYFTSKLQAQDDATDYVLEANQEAGLPAIDVSANQGKLLYLLAKMRGAKNILEIGTLGGFSSIWMARALPADGKLITLEYDEKHAQVAEQNIEKAGLGDKVDIMVGAALDTLPKVEQQGHTNFDFIFIDADKVNSPNYVQWALKLCTPGAVIIADNVVRNGRVIDPHSEDEGIVATRDLMDMMSREDRIESTAIQTVGSKGYDGFLIGVVKS